MTARCHAATPLVVLRYRLSSCAKSQDPQAETTPMSREAAPFACQAAVRSVRTARRLSSPSMGRDTLTLPKNKMPPAEGWAGGRAEASRAVAGGRPRSANHVSERGQDSERAEEVEATEPAESRPSRPGFRRTRARGTIPRPPFRSRRATPERPPRSGGQSAPQAIVAMRAIDPSATFESSYSSIKRAVESEPRRDWSSGARAHPERDCLFPDLGCLPK